MRLIVAITGASGAIFGVRALQRLQALDVESHLVISKWAERTIEHETPYSVAAVREMADCVHPFANLAAPISSGSFVTGGMLVAPCSVRALAAIRAGMTEDLVTRAADVVLKERRRLVLLVRETPLNDIHLANMLALSQMGATILPPVPAFYNHPASIEDIVDHVVVRALDQFGLHVEDAPRWDGSLGSPPRARGADARGGGS